MVVVGLLPFSVLCSVCDGVLSMLVCNVTIFFINGFVSHKNTYIIIENFNGHTALRIV